MNTWTTTKIHIMKKKRMTIYYYVRKVGHC